MPETKASRTTKTKAQHAEGEKKRPKLGAGKSSLKLGESPPPSHRGSTPRKGGGQVSSRKPKKEVTVEAERSSSPTVERPPSPLITVEEEAAPSAAPVAEPSSEDASAAALTAVREELRKAEERHASELAELRRQLAEASVVPPVQVRLNLGAALLTEPEVAKVAAVAAQAAVAASPNSSPEPTRASTSSDEPQAELARLRDELAKRDEHIHELEERLADQEHEVTVAVAAEALRGIQMMERMEKSIEKRKDREALLVGKLKDAFRGDIKQRELESRLQEVEAEATDQASEIEELRAALKER